jgi:hypothetical protein
LFVEIPELLLKIDQVSLDLRKILFRASIR